MPWIRQLLAGLLMRKAGFDPRLTPSEIYGGQSGTGAGFSLRVLWFSTVRIIPSVFHTHILILLLSKVQVGEAWEPSYK